MWKRAFILGTMIAVNVTWLGDRGVRMAASLSSTSSTPQAHEAARLQLFVSNLQHHGCAAKSNNSPTSLTQASPRPYFSGSHCSILSTNNPVKICQDHATSRSPERHTQHQILKHQHPPSGSPEKTPRGDDAFGGSQELVRTKYPLKPPKLSPSLFDMTRLTAVQDAWKIPTLDCMNPNAICKRC